MKPFVFATMQKKETRFFVLCSTFRNFAIQSWSNNKTKNNINT